jgi:HPt (histidine-containing phosphotransfer) domain-containing protein
MQVPVELKRRYLERRTLDIQNIRRSLELEDYAPALKLGHQMKGSAETFDFPQLAFIGIEIESASRRQDKESVRFLVQKLECNIEVEKAKFAKILGTNLPYRAAVN